MRKSMALMFLFGLLTSHALPARAETSSPVRCGFFLRLGIGPGYLYSRAGSDAARGPGLAYDMAVGGSPVGNLAVAFHAFGTTIVDPMLSGRGGFASGTSQGIFSSLGFGPGLTYYFMPLNIYITAAVGGAKIVFKRSGSTAQQSELGLGTLFSLGKEWTVSRSWSLGFAVQAHYSRITQSERPDLNLPDVHNASGALLLSATYY